MLLSLKKKRKKALKGQNNKGKDRTVGLKPQHPPENLALLS